MKKGNNKSNILNYIFITIVTIDICILILYIMYIITIKNLSINDNQEFIKTSSHVVMSNIEAPKIENKIDNNVIVNEVESNSINIENIENLVVKNKIEEQIEEKIQEKQTNTTKENITVKNNSASTQSKSNTTKTENEKSQKNETSKQSTTQTPPAPTIIGTDTKKDLINEETKYGVVTRTYTITTYNLYSDGTTKQINSTTSTEYDQSGYNATTSEILPEANQLKSQNNSLIQGVLNYTNQYRDEANENQINEVSNRNHLTLDSNLTSAACARAIEMAYAGKFSHTRPNGSSCFSILSEMNIGYMACGENIAWGQRSSQAVSTTWKNSPMHYSNMINPIYNRIGIGVINYRGTYYWVQIFAN